MAREGETASRGSRVGRRRRGGEVARGVNGGKKRGEKERVLYRTETNRERYT